LESELAMAAMDRRSDSQQRDVDAERDKLIEELTSKAGVEFVVIPPNKKRNIIVSYRPRPFDELDMNPISYRSQSPRILEAASNSPPPSELLEEGAFKLTPRSF